MKRLSGLAFILILVAVAVDGAGDGPLRPR